MPIEAQKWSARYLSSSIIFYFINFRFYLSAIFINNQAKFRMFFFQNKKKILVYPNVQILIIINTKNLTYLFSQKLKRNKSIEIFVLISEAFLMKI